MFWAIVCLITCIKILLIPSYRSTDFDVHRNWLAITHSLPITKWYYEDTSEWTLDYPPVFAYFEYILSQFAKYVDERMLDVNNLNYASPNTVLFQRFSVIITDLFLVFGVKNCIKVLSTKKETSFAVTTLIIGNIGLLIIDHIHFQYNGILFGILLLSIGQMCTGNYLTSAFLFAILLNMKHIFIYIAPAYIIFLLKFYVKLELNTKSFQRLVKLGVIVLGVTVASFGPFYQHIPQVLSRLFPFKRGLSHAYWAPNFWALYNFADKVLCIVKRCPSSSASTSSGLVQEFDHVILPSIKPVVTFALTVIFMLPICIKILRQQNYIERINFKQFIEAITLFALTSFMFGWHVHEKAILMAIIPISLLAMYENFHYGNIYFLSTIGHFSLLPLLFTPELLTVKLALFFTYSYISYVVLKRLNSNNTKLLSIIESIYLFGILFVIIFENILFYTFKLDNKYQFLPLMLISVYCAIGITYFWFKFYIQFLYAGSSTRSKRTKIM